MGFFSWECKGCNESIKAPYTIPDSLKWQNDAVVLMPNGSFIKGAYDGYGRIDGIEIEHEEREWWHVKCYREHGTPDYTGPSKHAQDQGYFYEWPDEDDDTPAWDTIEWWTS